MSPKNYTDLIRPKISILSLFDKETHQERMQHNAIRKKKNLSNKKLIRQVLLHRSQHCCNQ